MKDYSQFGETTIIVECVAAIERHGYPVPKAAVEFGAGDGYHLSNIRGLLDIGWIGLQFDKEPLPSSCFVIRKTIDVENINFAVTGLVQIGVISIDVDGNDYWIWKALVWEPCLVCIEFNQTLEGSLTIKYDPEHRWTGQDNYFGASFQALLALGHAKGYKLVARTTCNLIFVLAKLWPEPEPPWLHVPDLVWPAHPTKQFQKLLNIF